MRIDPTFLEHIHNGDWASALLLAQQGRLASYLNTSGSSIFAWLIELNAPPDLIVALLGHYINTESVDPNHLGLLEKCIYESNSKTNAFETFSSLLAYGLSPNVIVCGKGCTLLQEAMELNKVREVNELLKYGVDPYQMSIFGKESTSNLEEAARVGNAAGELVLNKFR